MFEKARTTIFENIKDKTPAQAIQTISNAISFVTYSQVLYDTDGTVIKKTFSGSVPVSGSIRVMGEAVEINDAKHTKERRIKEIPVFVLESFMRQVNAQIEARNLKINDYNKTVEVKLQITKLNTLTSPEQVRSLMLGATVPGVGVTKISSNFVYAGYEKCVNDVESLTNITPEFPEIPGIPNEPPVLTVPTVAEAGRSASASTGDRKVQSTIQQLGGGKTWKAAGIGG